MIKILTDVYREIKEIKNKAEFMPTGFHQLDYFLDGGFVRKELVVVGGYTGVGKSFLSAQVFVNIAMKGFKCIYFSLEISCPMIVSRLVGQRSNLKATRILYGLLNEEENQRRMVAKSELVPYEDLMHLADDIYRLNEIENVIKKNGYDFVVIDFIQNVVTDKGDEYSSMSFASVELQKIAKQCNCCILVVSQISNSAHKTGALEYKGSGGIAMVADLGFFIRKHETEKGRLSLWLEKNRRGISGNAFHLTFTSPGGFIK